MDGYKMSIGENRGSEAKKNTYKSNKFNLIMDNGDWHKTQTKYISKEPAIKAEFLSLVSKTFNLWTPELKFFYFVIFHIQTMRTN